jgi:hypothetical protein
VTLGERLLGEISALDAEIDQAKQELNQLCLKRRNRIAAYIGHKGVYKPEQSKSSSGYYNVDVERTEGNWKGREHN